MADNTPLYLFDGDRGGASALISLGGHDLVVVGAKVLQYGQFNNFTSEYRR
jgi:hypothetical protein